MDEEHEKRVTISRRSAQNEASLIWSLLGAAIFLVVLFLDVAAIMLPWNIHPYVFSGIVAIGLSGMVAKLHFVKASAEINNARNEIEEMMNSKREEMQKERMAKLHAGDETNTDETAD